MRTAVHFLGVLLGLSKPETQVTSSELKVLEKYAATARVLVEIGTFEGATALRLAAVTKGSVYTVDPFFSGRLGLNYGELGVRLLKLRRRLGNLHILKAFSADAAASFRYSVDFLFIDADHTFDGVRRDWESWFDKVISGGVVALHDCRIAPNSPRPLGSMRFYEEYLRSHPLVKEVDGVDSLAVFIKS